MGLQEQEYSWYKSHLDELSKKYGGRSIVIKGHKVINTYDNHSEAYLKTVEDHKLGTFIIQDCPKPGQKNYVVSLSSFVKH